MLIYILIGLTIVFAFWCEFSQQSGNYSLGKPRERDSHKTALMRMQVCMTVEKRTIKWRRLFVGSSLVAVLVPLMLLGHFPNEQELLTILLVTYFTFAMVDLFYFETVSKKVINYGNTSFRKLCNSMDEKDEKYHNKRLNKIGRLNRSLNHSEEGSNKDDKDSHYDD